MIIKELTIIEKAQRYDKAIARANELNYVSDKNSLQRKTVEHIFPELKESEDKVEPKFHKGDWIVHDVDTDYVYHVESVGVCYHLRKGGTLVLMPFIEEKYYHLWTIQDAKDGDVLCCESGWTCIFKELNHNSFGEKLFDSHCFIDKTKWFHNGAKGHTLNERINGKIYPATEEQRDLLFQKMKEAGYEWNAEKRELKKIEHKSAEKVEPKFGVGDIIKHKDTNETFEVSRIEIFDADEIYYHLTNGGCICENSDNFELVKQKPADEVEPKFHKGDTDEYIEVKGLSEIEAEAEELTKEMSDEKHNLTDFERTLADICIGWIGEEPGWKEYIKDNADILLKIAVKKFNSVQEPPFEQKPAWSEKDEKIRRKCIRAMRASACGFPEEENFVKQVDNWLNSLKERVQPQPKQELSEEDEMHIRELESLVKQVWATAEHENDKNTIHKMSDLSFFLKTLKPQLKQELSEEDEKEYKYVLKFVDNILNNCGNKKDYEHCKRCYDWLKSLRPQNNITDEELAQAKKDAYNDALDKIEYHSGEPTFDDGWSAAIWYLKKKNAMPQAQWKPSDEQMKALEFVVKSLDNMLKAIGHIDNITKPRLEEILKALKKLREG